MTLEPDANIWGELMSKGSWIFFYLGGECIKCSVI